jgi:hypothetical protein
MVDKKRDPEIEALQAVHTALKPLSADERTRVLASVYALLDITGPVVKPSSGSPSRPAQTPTADAPTVSISPRSQVRPVSINELVQEKSPGTNAQRIALFAYYRDKHEGNPRFTRDELKAYFAKAKEQPPTNYDRDFVEAVKKGWIHEDGADSYVTSKGIEAVESAFAGERKYTKRPGRPRTTGRSGTKKSKSKNQHKKRSPRK